MSGSNWFIFLSFYREYIFIFKYRETRKIRIKGMCGVFSGTVFKRIDPMILIYNVNWCKLVMNSLAFFSLSLIRYFVFCFLIFLRQKINFLFLRDWWFTAHKTVSDSMPLLRKNWKYLLQQRIISTTWFFGNSRAIFKACNNVNCVFFITVKISCLSRNRFLKVDKYRYFYLSSKHMKWKFREKTNFDKIFE